MKHFLITVGLAVGALGHVAAQQAAPPRTEVTQKGFSHRVAALGKAMKHDSREESEAIFSEINRMASAEVGATREKMRQAATEADKAKYRQLMLDQRTLFADALRLKQQDMKGNQKDILKKLDQFAATIQ